MFSLDDRNIRSYEKDLRVFARSALPHATKRTLNDTVSLGRLVAQQEIQKVFVNRNQYTVRGVRFTRANTLDIDKQEARFGHIAPYMAVQEDGATRHSTGSVGVPTPTPAAAGEADTASIRRKTVRRRNFVKAIQLAKRTRKGSRKQSNAATISAAMAKPAAGYNRYVYLDLGKRKGIFRLKGSKRVMKPVLIQDLSKRTITIPKKPTIGKAEKVAREQLPVFYLKRLQEQVAMRGLFRART